MRTKNSAVAIFFTLIILGFVAFGGSSNYWGWGRSHFVFQGTPNVPAVSWHPTYVNFAAGSSFVSAPIIYRPYSFRFVLFDP